LAAIMKSSMSWRARSSPAGAARPPAVAQDRPRLDRLQGQGAALVAAGAQPACHLVLPAELMGQRR